MKTRITSLLLLFTSIAFSQHVVNRANFDFTIGFNLTDQSGMAPNYGSQAGLDVFIYMDDPAKLYHFVWGATVKKYEYSNQEQLRKDWMLMGNIGVRNKIEDILYLNLGIIGGGYMPLTMGVGYHKYLNLHPKLAGVLALNSMFQPHGFDGNVSLLFSVGFGLSIR